MPFFVLIKINFKYLKSSTSVKADVSGDAPILHPSLETGTSSVNQSTMNILLRILTIIKDTGDENSFSFQAIVKSFVFTNQNKIN